MKKKLQLRKETIANLENHEMKAVNGGIDTLLCNEKTIRCVETLICKTDNCGCTKSICITLETHSCPESVFVCEM
ncbi:MAG: class I lanthipeptide [Hyphomicrobiales bacterium]